MRIITSAHGAFPSLNELTQNGPRIAFVNASENGCCLQTLEKNNCLIIESDDLDVLAISAWLRGLLVLPPIFSYRVKRYSWNESKQYGMPSAPMCMGDALAILDFVEKLVAQNEQELLISCEYGKSRSVTTASFLRAMIANEKMMIDENVPNAWVHYLLGLARSRRMQQGFA